MDRIERVGDLILMVVPDTLGDYSDPRAGDNLSEMVFLHRRYSLGDRQEVTPGEGEALRGGGFEGLRKHLERLPAGLVAITEVGMLDHSGLTIYPVSGTGPKRGEHWVDPGGWDSACSASPSSPMSDGMRCMVAIPRDRWTARSDLPLGSVPVTRRLADEALLSEIREYDSYLRGDVWGYVVVKPCDDLDDHDEDDLYEIADCPHSDEIESCYGFIGDAKYAWEEGLAAAQAAATPA